MGVGLFNEMCWRLHSDLSMNLVVAGALVGNAAFALLACFLLRHSLSRRIYSF
jgi:hypothetical protein